MTVASPEKESCSEFEKTCPTVYAAGGGEFIRSAPAVIATVEDDDEELGSEDSDFGTETPNFDGLEDFDDDDFDDEFDDDFEEELEDEYDFDDFEEGVTEEDLKEVDDLPLSGDFVDEEVEEEPPIVEVPPEEVKKDEPPPAKKRKKKKSRGKKTADDDDLDDEDDDD